MAAPAARAAVTRRRPVDPTLDLEVEVRKLRRDTRASSPSWPAWIAVAVGAIGFAAPSLSRAGDAPPPAPAPASAPTFADKPLERWIEELTRDAAGRAAILAMLLDVPMEVLRPQGARLVESARIVLLDADQNWYGLQNAVLLVARLGSTDVPLRARAMAVLMEFLAKAPLSTDRAQLSLGPSVLLRVMVFAQPQDYVQAPRAHVAVPMLLWDVFAKHVTDRTLPVPRRVAMLDPIPCWGLARLGLPSSLLVDRCADSEPEIAMAAARALWFEGVIGPELLVLLSRPEESVRFAALAELRQIRFEYRYSATQVAALREQARNGPSSRVRALAALVWMEQWALTRGGPLSLPLDFDRASCAQALTAGLESDDEDVRAGAARRLRELPTEAQDALPALRRLMTSKDPRTASTAKSTVEILESATRKK